MESGIIGIDEKVKTAISRSGQILASSLVFDHREEEGS